MIVIGHWEQCGSGISHWEQWWSVISHLDKWLERSVFSDWFLGTAVIITGDDSDQ